MDTVPASPAQFQIVGLLPETEYAYYLVSKSLNKLSANSDTLSTTTSQKLLRMNIMGKVPIWDGENGKVSIYFTDSANSETG